MTKKIKKIEKLIQNNNLEANDLEQEINLINKQPYS